MATLRKIGNEYFVEYYAQGLKFAKRGGTDLAHAEKLKNQIEASYPERMEDMYTVRDDSADSFFKAFRQYAKKEFPDRTYRRYISVCNHFEDFLNHHLSAQRKIREITPRLIEEYKAYLLKLNSFNQVRVKPQMINFTLYILGDIMEYAITCKSLNDNPARHVQFLETDHRQSLYVLEEEEKKNILSGCDEETSHQLQFLLSTGLNSREMKDLEWRDVDFDNNLLSIRHGSGNEEGVRAIPMNAAVLNVLKRQFKKSNKDHGSVFLEFSPDQLRRTLDQISSNEAIKFSLTERTLRNTFVVELLKKKVSMKKILIYCGWADIARLMYFETYYSLSQSAR